MAQGLAKEEIRHEDLVLVGGVGVGEDIGALESLVAESEDIIDDEDGGGGVRGAGGVCEAGRVSGWELRRLWTREGGGDSQHFIPPLRSIYLPLGLYPFETAGGTLQHACNTTSSQYPYYKSNPINHIPPPHIHTWL